MTSEGPSPVGVNRMGWGRVVWLVLTAAALLWPAHLLSPLDGALFAHTHSRVATSSGSFGFSETHRSASGKQAFVLD